jgi:23S rRNA-/tRNA-specific pseudouridylate synthase
VSTAHPGAAARVGHRLTTQNFRCRASIDDATAAAAAAAADEEMEEEGRQPPPPPLRPIRVIYEDADVLAVDKPRDMSFHSDDLVHHAPGVLATLRALQATGELRGSSYAGPLHSVHRLDKITSGVLLFAKNEDTVR